MRRMRLWVGLGVLVAGAAAGGWFGWPTVQLRQRLGRLETATDADLAERAGQVAELGDPAVPRLLELLKKDEPVPHNARAALARIADAWPADDSREAAFVGELAAEYGSFSPSGRYQALVLAEMVIERSKGRAEPVREMARAGLKDECAECRAASVALAARPEIGLVGHLVPLLGDGCAEVRRAALAAVGPNRDLVADEDLLRWLHDPDAGVRTECEDALRGRGLREKDVRMGRLVTDPSFRKRIEVVNYLPGDNQIDASVWLTRLTQDPVPAVRAAAARAATDPDLQLSVDMTARLRQMAQSDPDGTVRQIVLELLKGRAAN